MVGVVLAGGCGSRMAGLGASKPALELGGRALIEWPLAALAQCCSRVAVTCKADTPLPALGAGVERWDEPDEPRHPLTGIVTALQRARVDVLVCAADVPYLDAQVLGALVARAGVEPDARAVIACTATRLEPTLGIYRQAALWHLRRAVSDAPLWRTVEGLGPARVVVDGAAVRSVNTPTELERARTELVGA